MFKKLQNLIWASMFQDKYEIGGDNRFIPIVVPIYPALLESFKNTVVVWGIARKLENEKKGKIKCSFRENDGTLNLPLEYEKSFILYVSESDSDDILCSYEIMCKNAGQRLLISSERIHSTKDMRNDEALKKISADIDQQLDLL